jgi:sarcosine oxidase subunit beta
VRIQYGLEVSSVSTSDVVIVGAGVIGSSIAFHLAQAGVKRVVVVERRHLAAGATGKSGALVRTHYTNEPETRLAVESLKYFQNWRELVGGECGFQRVGLVVFVPPEMRQHLEANVAMHRRVGANAQVITADEARDLDPSVSTDDVTHVAYEPDSGFADPSATTYAFARAAQNRGVEFRLDTPVTRVLTQGDRVVGIESPTGAIEAPIVVIAAGAWANQLFAGLGIDLGMVPTLSRIAIFRWAFDRAPRHPTYIDHVRHTWIRPVDGNCTLIGAELGVNRSTGIPDDYSEAVPQEYIERCRTELIHRFPVMRHGTMRGNWAGIFMRSPDSLPVIDHLPQYNGLYCMTGDSGSSFKTSPIIGKCLAEWIVDGKARTVDLSPFRSTRFAEGRPWVDLTGYSDQALTISR